MIAQRIAEPWVKNLIIVILIFYMYGSICLKYVSGAESLVAGISYTFWKDEKGLNEALGFDSYYLGLIVFGFFGIYFSFGNIENAKTLMIVISILRFIVTGLMIIGSIYYLKTDGPHPSNMFNWKTQIKHLAQVFGNTCFIFVYHHSISGIVYPVRPQKEIKKVFKIS